MSDKILIIPLLVVVAIIISIHFLFGGNNSPSSVIVNPTNDQKNSTISSIEPEENEGNDIFGFKKTVTNMALFFDTLLEKVILPEQQKKYGITAM